MPLHFCGQLHTMSVDLTAIHPTIRHIPHIAIRLVAYDSMICPHIGVCNDFCSNQDLIHGLEFVAHAKWGPQVGDITLIWY